MSLQSQGSTLTSIGTCKLGGIGLRALSHVQSTLLRKDDRPTPTNRGRYTHKITRNTNSPNLHEAASRNTRSNMQGIIKELSPYAPGAAPSSPDRITHKLPAAKNNTILHQYKPLKQIATYAYTYNKKHRKIQSHMRRTNTQIQDMTKTTLTLKKHTTKSQNLSYRYPQGIHHNTNIHKITKHRNANKNMTTHKDQKQTPKGRRWIQWFSTVTLAAWVSGLRLEFLKEFITAVKRGLKTATRRVWKEGHVTNFFNAFMKGQWLRAMTNRDRRCQFGWLYAHAM